MNNFIRTALILLLLVPNVSIAEYRTGGVYGCARVPNFIFGLGLQQPAIDTTVIKYPGVVIRDLQGQQRLYQHPSWKITGHVGSTVRDSQGNVYIVPVPTIGLDTNPLARRNIVYRIDGNTGLLNTFVELPVTKQESQSNPFGTLGLAYDCETNSLYVSSVADSSHDSVNGVIYQINVATQEIVDKLVGIDALGVGVFNAATQKRLYYGDARSSSLFSVPLTSTGNFNHTEAKRYEQSLLALRNGDSTQIRKISFTTDRAGTHAMTLSETEFSYRLNAETGLRYKNYYFEWSAEEQKWQFMSVALQ